MRENLNKICGHCLFSLSIPICFLSCRWFNGYPTKILNRRSQCETKSATIYQPSYCKKHRTINNNNIKNSKECCADESMNNLYLRFTRTNDTNEIERDWQAKSTCCHPPLPRSCQWSKAKQFNESHVALLGLIKSKQTTRFDVFHWFPLFRFPTIFFFV